MQRVLELPIFVCEILIHVGLACTISLHVGLTADCCSARMLLRVRVNWHKAYGPCLVLQKRCKVLWRSSVCKSPLMRLHRSLVGGQFEAIGAPMLVRDVERRLLHLRGARQLSLVRRMDEPPAMPLFSASLKLYAHL